jgi:hypothetical protein
VKSFDGKETLPVLVLPKCNVANGFWWIPAECLSVDVCRDVSTGRDPVLDWAKGDRELLSGTRVQRAAETLAHGLRERHTSCCHPCSPRLPPWWLVPLSTSSINEDKVLTSIPFSVLQIQVVHQQNYWHFGQDCPLWWGHKRIASLTSAHQMPILPSPSHDNQQGLQNLSNMPWGRVTPQLRRTVLFHVLHLSSFH